MMSAVLASTSATQPVDWKLVMGSHTNWLSCDLLSTTAASITDGGCTWRYIGKGLNYSGLEILVEQVTAATGNQAVSVGYSTMGADGVTLTTTRSTGAVGVSAGVPVSTAR